MNDVKLPYVILLASSVFLSSLSQVLLKKAALRPHKNFVAEYLDWRVLLAYGIFFVCTLLTMFSYKGVPLSMAPVVESTGYLYGTVFAYVFFKEKITRKKLIAIGIIISGVLVSSL